MYQYRDDKFNEWQLGLLQAKANAINAAMHYDVERQNVYLSQSGLLVFSWEIGKEPLVYVGSTPMTIGEYLAALERLGAALFDIGISVGERLNDLAEILKGLQDGTGD